MNAEGFCAGVAQPVEQLICNQQVNGSSPFIGLYGWIPEWPKGTDCKSAGFAFDGSNPSSSTKPKANAKAFAFSLGSGGS